MQPTLLTTADHHDEEAASSGSRRQDPRHFDIHLGPLLRRARRAAGFSREAVADALELSVGRLASYEQGVRSISAKRLSRLTELYEVDIRGLVAEAGWLQRQHVKHESSVVFRLDVERLLASAEQGPLARYVLLQPERRRLDLTAHQISLLAQLYGRTVADTMDLISPWSADSQTRATGMIAALPAGGDIVPPGPEGDAETDRDQVFTRCRRFTA